MDEIFTILAVDDEPNNLKLLQEILAGTYELKFAKNGDLALLVAEKHEPDLILLDIMMPGMDGYEVCRQLKKSAVTKDIPVIFITAMGKEEDETRGFDFGAVDYITKPVKAPIVLARVKTHLALKAAQDKIRAQNKELKEQARKLYDFGAKKKAQVEEMASEVAKAMQAISKEQSNYIKSLADILQKATQEDKQQVLIESIKAKIESGVKKMEQFPAKEVGLKGLQQGMVTAQDIVGRDGRLILASGEMITEGLIESLNRRLQDQSIFVVG